MKGGSQRVARIVGRCVYCGTDRYDAAEPLRPLSDEHIVPQSLGGDLLLKEASCKSCEGVTSAFEGVAARSLFGPLRIHAKLPTRRKKLRPATLPIIHNKDGLDTEIEVPVEDHPLMVNAVKMSPPQILAKDNGDNNVIISLFPAGMEYTNAKMQQLGERLGIKNVYIQGRAAHRNDFGMLLAKMAHCYTVATFGINGFYPFLDTIIITKQNDNLKLYVGGTIDSIQSNETDNIPYHVFSPHYFYRGRQKLIVWNIRLFSKTEFPQYSVVSGRLYENAPEIGIPGKVIHDKGVNFVLV